MSIKKSAVILSGGKNSRMGYETKAFLKLNDRKFIDLIIESLKDYDDIIVSCNKLEDYKYLKQVTFIEDEIKDIGPMGGIYSCLKKCNYNKCLFVAADMPFINKNVIDTLSYCEFNEVFIKSNNYFKIRNLLKLINVKYIEINDNKAFINVNTKEEYENIKKEEE